MNLTVPLEGFGGSGDCLNFEVVAYPTEEAFWTATLEKNTFAIITTTPINGWALSPGQPENPDNGAVWIEVGDNGEISIDAFKKTGIRIYPVSASQYVNGSWNKVDAFLNQNGEKVKFGFARYYVFKSGEGAKINYLTDSDDNSSISVGTSSINISHSDSTTGFYTLFRSEEKIDLSKYKTLYMKCKPSVVLANDHYKDWYNSVGFTSKAITTVEPGSSPWTARTRITQSSSEKTITVDVSSITTSLYFMIDFSGTMSVTEIWVE